MYVLDNYVFFRMHLNKKKTPSSFGRTAGLAEALMNMHCTSLLWNVHSCFNTIVSPTECLIYCHCHNCCLSLHSAPICMYWFRHVWSKGGLPQRSHAVRVPELRLPSDGWDDSSARPVHCAGFPGVHHDAHGHVTWSPSAWSAGRWVWQEAYSRYSHSYLFTVKY